MSLHWRNGVKWIIIIKIFVNIWRQTTHRSATNAERKSTSNRLTLVHIIKQLLRVVFLLTNEHKLCSTWLTISKVHLIFQLKITFKLQRSGRHVTLACCECWLCADAISSWRRLTCDVTAFSCCCSCKLVCAAVCSDVLSLVFIRRNTLISTISSSSTKLPYNGLG